MPFCSPAPRTLARSFAPALLAAGLVLGVAPPTALAHCQVPCGIYGDTLKLDQLNQDVETVRKATAELHKLLDGSAPDAQTAQQIVRWTTNKEAHADRIMQEMQSYFLAQRVKLPADDASDDDRAAYLQQLHEIHAVIVHAMKTKQQADPAAVEGLQQSLDTFRQSYLGEHEGHTR